MNYIREICSFLFDLIPVVGKKNKIKGVPLYKFLGGVKIRGNNNVIKCYTNKIGNMKITIYGNNHYLEIGKDVIYKKGTIWFEDNNNKIIIGEKSTIEDAHLAAAENDTIITIGENCMLSSDIYITTTDSHSILNIETGTRTNKASNVTIGKHVWIGRNVTINKGTVLGDNTIVSGNSVCTKTYPENTIVAGIPAKVIREKVTWQRERI